jgi:hypothetical protein
MKVIQVISGLSIIYFLIQCVINDVDEAKMEALMGTITMLLIFLLSSHLYGIQKNDIADEIKENHKRSIARNNGANRVQGAKDTAKTNTAK